MFCIGPLAILFRAFCFPIYDLWVSFLESLNGVLRGLWGST
jgi:hypothetical protein